MKLGPMSCASSHAFGVTLLEGEAGSLSEAIGAPRCSQDPGLMDGDQIVKIKDLTPDPHGGRGRWFRYNL